jgi:ribokinase
MAARIAVVGSMNMDLVVKTPHLPKPGETVIGEDLLTVPGGKGANQAVAAARLGAKVAMIGRVGDDLFGQQLRENLIADQIDLRHVIVTPGTGSGVALIVVDEKGQNSIVVSSGANARVTVADVDSAAKAITTADVLVLQLEIPLEAVTRAAQLARQSGVQVILNPAPAQKLPADLLALVDILIPNESETATITALSIESQEEMGAAAAELMAAGVGSVILTLGERGAFLAQKGATRHFPPFVVDQVVDTTAAGDAFVGGLASAIGEGKPIMEAVSWGNAAGALAVTRTGAQLSLPIREEVERLLARK